MSCDFDTRLRSLAAEPSDGPAVVVAGPAGGQELSWAELESATRQRPQEGPYGAAVVPTANDLATVVRIVSYLRHGVSFVPVATEAADAFRRLVERLGRTNPEWSRGVPYHLATGGSTGLPKLVPYPEEVRYSPDRVPNLLLRQCRWRARQRQLVVAPLYHSSPFMCFLQGLLDGNTVVLLSRFVPKVAFDVIERAGVNWVQLTPSHLSLLSGLPVRARRFRSIEALVHTGAACPVQLKNQWLELLGPERVFEYYGSTESYGMTFVTGGEWLRREGTVGRGFFTQIKIIADGLRAAPGTVGEIFMRRPSGRRSAEGGRADGFVSVGDYGRLDSDGYLFLSPRRDGLIIVGGSNVYPAEVENVLNEHPDVLDSRVFGQDDDTLGQVLVADVVARPGRRVTSDALLEFCAGRLDHIKLPHRVNFVEDVGRTQVGKLRRTDPRPPHENGRDIA